jgi:hypothetical protein
VFSRRHIDVMPQSAALDYRDLCARIDRHPSHPRQIEQ